MNQADFSTKVAAPKQVPDMAQNPWYWNPNRLGIQFASEDFLERLHQIGEELSCVYNPLRSRWVVFAKTHTIQHKLCNGWRLLFIHEDADGNYMPLDERLFARLVYASVYSHRDAKQYFERVTAEQERDKAKREAQNLIDQIDMAMPHWEHSQISVSGFGKSNGSKFSTYHS